MVRMDAPIVQAVPSVTVNCVCGRESPELAFIEETDHDGAIWQGTCGCGRSFTLEVANDPDMKDD